MRNNLLLPFSFKKELDVLPAYFLCDYNIYTAANSDEVLRLVETVSIQLIIWKSDMPGLNGWELCSRLKSSVQYSHIPFILLTTDDSFPAKIKNLESGADAYVNMPFSLKYLEMQIRNLLTNREKIKAHFECSRLENAETSTEEFVKKLYDHIYINVQNSSLNANLLSSLMNMSRPTFYRKIKMVTELTPNDLINLVRLKYAAKLLETAEYKINEIATMTGFQSQSSLGRAFIKQYKVTPTEYQRLKKKIVRQKRKGIQDKYFGNVETAVFNI
jgi:two-component system, cell cycle response regulator